MTKKGIPKATVKGVSKRDLLPAHSKDELLRLSEERISFAFNFLDLQHEAFNCGGTESNWFLHLFSNLASISGLSRNEFFAQRNHYDVHGHKWDELDYKYNLPAGMLEQVEEDCIQFRLSSSGGRVHGFLIQNKFYVVWFDPHHNLYPSQKHGGRKFFEKPLNPFEELLVENEALREQNKEYARWIEELTTPGITGQ